MTTPPGRPMRADARRNRERVFEAARELFASERADVSVEEIARTAGVGIGTMYRNWPTRLDLVDELFHEDLDALISGAGELQMERAPWSALVWWLERYLALLQAKRGMLTELRGACDKHPEMLGESRRKILDATVAVLERAQTAGTVRADLTAADLVQLVSGMVLPAITEPSRYPYLLELVLVGIRAPVTRRPLLPATGLDAAAGRKRQTRDR